MARGLAVGTIYENKTRAIGEELGYLVASTRHFNGPGDQIWFSPNPDVMPLLVEVKATADLPWRSTWGPEPRVAMHVASAGYGLEPVLCWWAIVNGRMEAIWMPPEDWPAVAP